MDPFVETFGIEIRNAPDGIFLHVLLVRLAASRNFQVGRDSVVGIRVGRDGVGEYPAVDGPVQVPDEAHVSTPRKGLVHLKVNSTIKPFCD